MRYMRLVLCTVLSLFSARATIASAQILSTTTRTLSTTTIPDSTISLLTKRIEALESIVAQLQQKTAFIKSVSPLMFDAGGDLSIRGGQISVDAMNTFSLRAGAGARLSSGAQLLVEASTQLDLKGSGGLNMRSGGQLLVEAASTLDLKGATIRNNGGTSPVACLASSVNGQTGAGGGLRGDHTHAVVLQVSPCGSSVLVPPPGQ